MKKVVLALNSPAGRRWKLRGKRRATRGGIPFTRVGQSYISDWLSDEVADAQEGFGVSFVTKAVVEPEEVLDPKIVAEGLVEPEAPIEPVQDSVSPVVEPYKKPSRKRAFKSK